MKENQLTKKILASVSAFALLFAVTQPLRAASGNGTDHGYYWAYWVNTGTCSISFPGAGTYGGLWHLQWANITDGGGGKGWNPGSNTRSVNYNSSDPYYLNYGAYGWAPYPTYEMYIQDRSSSQSAGGTYKGSINSDGGTYKVYSGTQATYSGGGKQYVSKRTSNTSGSGNHTITTSNHMNWWASHGMSHGTWQDWKLNVEDYGSNHSGASGGNVW